MSLEHIIVLAIVQGLTEFLPISSSGHLNLIHLLTAWPDQGPVIDVALHVGSLFAVFLYFWRDTGQLAIGVRDTLTFRQTPAARLFQLLIVATIPLFSVGFVLFETGLIEALRTVEVIAWANLIFAILLYAVDKHQAQERELGTLNLKGAIGIGLFQAFALLPGASRSGACMTAARAYGFKRTESARLATLMAIPAILGAGLLATLDVLEQGDLQLGLDAITAAILAFIVAYLSIWGMMALLRRTSMTPFVIYRVVLGLILFWIAYD